MVNPSTTQNDKAVTASKTRIVVTKRNRSNNGKKIAIRRGGTGTIRKLVVKQSASSNTTATSGLPSFQHRHATSVADATDPQHKSNNDNDDDDQSSSSSIPEDIASETLVAIHSIIQSQQGLSIPLSHNQSIQAVLENQIYATFHETNATSIHRELLELVERNQVRQLYCQDQSTTAYVLTSDFVQAVWDACHRGLSQEHSGRQDDEIVSWYVSNLEHWTGRTVSTSEMEVQWEKCEEKRRTEATTINESSGKQTTASRPFETALKHLMDLQLLIRDTQQTTVNSHQDRHYYMWLPQWAIVLKSWNEAKQQLITLLARSKEMSKMNLLRQNRHSHVSTQFLLNELVYKGVVTVIERPFGTFVQLVRDNKP